MNIRRSGIAALALLLALAAARPAAAAAQARPAPPPEYKQLAAALNTADAAARLEELERIKLAFPDSQYMEVIETYILIAKMELAATLDAVLALQKEALDRGPARLRNPGLVVLMADRLLTHPRLAAFDKARVLEAVAAYRDLAAAAAADPAGYEGVPADQRDYAKAQIKNSMELALARASLNAGDAGRAEASLDAYRRAGGPATGDYLLLLGGLREAAGRVREAYEAYLSAAADDVKDAEVRARALYAKARGRTDGFEAELAAKLKALPFHPEPFKAPAGWKGKAVLAELFTGSECPPCVAADLAFDGLGEVFPAKYAVVLVYHLPIPRPDPMMNPASEARQAYYGVNSTPTVFIDGVRNATGGGSRGMAEGKFSEYRSAIEALLPSDPALRPAVKASLAGDKVRATFDPGQAAPDAAYNLVLVQDVQEHKGGNGVVFHRMVVRDLLEVDPKGDRSAAFDLAASEKATDAYLSAFETSYTRVPGFKWEVRRHQLPRRGLKVVFFVQEKASRRVLNVAVADVE